MIRDLLNPSSGFLDLREDSKGVIQVAGITEVSTINAQEVREANYACCNITFILNKTFRLYAAIVDHTCLCVLRSWNCWWRVTNSAPRSQQLPIRHHLAPTPCCRWPSSNRVGVEMYCRRFALHASSWLTSLALNVQHRCIYQSGAVWRSEMYFLFHSKKTLTFLIVGFGGVPDASENTEKYLISSL